MRALSLIFMLGFLAAGCARARGPAAGAAGADAGPELDPIPEAEFEAAMARAHCAFEARCCRRAGLPGVIDSCEQTWRKIVANDRPSPDSGARYDGAAAAACIAELADFECPHVKELERPWPEPCGHIYRRGMLQLGERCSKTGPYECALADGAETVCWDRSGVADRYECIPVAERGEGEPCRDLDLEVRAVVTCARPLYCDVDRGVCIRLPDRDEPCASDPFGEGICGRGSVCDAATRRCVAPIDPGEPCDGDGSRCEASQCVEGRCPEPIRRSRELCAHP